MAISIFIDGAAGTTGLLIEQLLRTKHPHFEPVVLSEAERKSPEAKRRAFAEADCAVLCLPDAAAAESAALAHQLGVRVLDASSAHRVAPGWTYGLPELNRGAQRQEICGAWRVANPGCYASGAVLMLQPLLGAGIVLPDAHVPIFGVSGYSGGGRAFIDEFGPGRSELKYATYSHGKEHKHVREIAFIAGLTRSPQFVPSVAGFERGMAVVIQLGRDAFAGPQSATAVRDIWRKAYAGERYIFVEEWQQSGASKLLAVDHVVDTNNAHLYCFDSGDGVTLLCHLDNLGKGAAFAAVQNLNIMFAFNEGEGLS